MNGLPIRGDRGRDPRPGGIARSGRVDADRRDPGHFARVGSRVRDHLAYPGRMRFEEPSKTRLRRHLLDRGRVLATLLAEVLAGKPVAAKLTAIGIPGKPGMRPEEKLRLALDQIETRRKLLESDDDRFGRCDVCAVELGAAALGELPWADRCHAHAGS